MVEMVMKVSVLDVAADKNLMILCVILMSDKYNAILISLQYNPGKALVDMQHVGLWGSAVVAKEQSLDEIFFFFPPHVLRHVSHISYNRNSKISLQKQTNTPVNAQHI